MYKMNDNKLIKNEVDEYWLSDIFHTSIFFVCQMFHHTLKLMKPAISPLYSTYPLQENINKHANVINL